MPEPGELVLARSRESGAAVTTPAGPPSREAKGETTVSCAPVPSQADDLTKGATPPLGTASVKDPERRASCSTTPPATTGSATTAIAERETGIEGGTSCPAAPLFSTDLATRKLSTGLAEPALSHDNLGGAENAPIEPN